MTHNPSHQPVWLQLFGTTWRSLTSDSLDLVDKLYHPQVRFEDPSGVIEGRRQLKQHLQHLYQNTLSVEFQLSAPLVVDNTTATQPWVMTFRHPKLAKAKPIKVDGVSILIAEQGLIISHRDYFDMGQMLYEQLPLLGSLVKRVKQRVSP